MKDQIIALVTEQRNDYRSASSQRAVANTADAARATLFQEQIHADRDLIAAQQKEIERLRNPGWLRSLFKADTFAAVGAGFALCTATRK